MGDNRDLLLSTLLDNFVQNKCNRQCYSTFLSALQDGQLLGCKKASVLGDVASQINSLLNTSKGRLEGLCLLNQTLQQCTTEVFLHSGTTWARLLLAILQSHDPPLTYQMACHVTGTLMRHASRFPELSRELSSSIVPQLLTVFLDASDERTPASLEGLSLCMTYFPGPCGPFKNKIEHRVVAALFNRQNKSLCDVASNCYSLLAGCGGGGNQGVKHTEAWTRHCNLLLSTLHRTLDEMYTGVGMDTESYTQKYTVPEGKLEWPSLPEAEPQRTYILVEHSAVLFKCLCDMLSTEFKSTAQVPVDALLGLLCHALSVTAKQLSHRPTQEKLYFLSVLPLLQKEAMHTLGALIMCVKSHLIIHSETVNQLFIQVLDWSSSPRIGYGQSRPYGSLRKAVWETLEIWLKTLTSSSGVEDYAESLLTHLLQEVSPHVQTVKLTSKGAQDGSTSEAKSKKKKRKGLGEVGELTMHRKMDEYADADACQRALQVLVQLTLAVGCFLKPSHHKSIQEFLVPTLLNIQHEAHDVPIPYSHPGCRRALYHVLLASVLCPHPNYPPPTQCAIGIFSQGLQDPELQVLSFCTEALAVCESIIHPRAPPLNHPIMTTKISSTDSDVQENIGESASVTLTSAQTILGTLSSQASTIFGSLSSQVPTLITNGQSEPAESTADVMDTMVTEKKSDSHETEHSLNETLEKPLPSPEDGDENEDEKETQLEVAAGQNTDIAVVTGDDEPGNTDISSVEEEVNIGDITPKIIPLDGKVLEKGPSPVDGTTGATSEDSAAAELNNGKEMVKEIQDNDQSAQGRDTNTVSPEIKVGMKRKMDDSDKEEDVAKKKLEMDEADQMLEAFVDADPDSD